MTETSNRRRHAIWALARNLTVYAPIAIGGAYLIDRRVFIVYPLIGNPDSVLYDRNVLQLAVVGMAVPFAAAWAMAVKALFKRAARIFGIKPADYN